MVIKDILVLLIDYKLLSSNTWKIVAIEDDNITRETDIWVQN